MRIECGSCRMEGTDLCEECVVTFICGRSEDDAVVFDAVEERAIRLLQGAGMLPDARYVRVGRAG